MGSALDLHRLHFAFTITYHYLFPQLTMGLALLILILKTVALRTGERVSTSASARFWAKIFGINFALGVVTGIPMEFQFGTNWAEFSRVAGGVIGHTFAMEGVFSFFLESSFLGLFLYGEKRLGKIGHWWAAFFVFLGSWMSGYLIVATDAWMQHPTGYQLTPTGGIELSSFWGLLLNPWALAQYAHTMLGAVQTGCFVMAAVGVFYLLDHRDTEYGKIFVRAGVIVGVIAALLQLSPTGDIQGKMVTRYQPATLAGMEGLFESQDGAPLVILGQPDVKARKLDNVIQVPSMLSFLTYRKWSAHVQGLNAFPEDQVAHEYRVALLQLPHHGWVGHHLRRRTGGRRLPAVAQKTFRIALDALDHFLICVPLPYIANTAGWMTAELGRQPWLIHGLMRTIHGASPSVGAGNTLFTLLGFLGLYSLLSILWLFLIYREIDHGPQSSAILPAGAATPAAAD